MIRASEWDSWISDALQAVDVTLTRSSVGDSGSDVELSVPTRAGPVRERFKVKKWSAFKPSTVDLLPRLHRGDLPLLVVADRMSEEAVDRLRRGRYSWLSRRPLSSGLRGELRTAQEVHALHDMGHPDASPGLAGRGRPGRGAGQLVQALFYLGEATQKDLVEATGLSQARISQLLRELHGSGVVSSGSRPVRWTVVDPDRLMSVWLDRYAPEERITSYWYGLDGLQEQARTTLAALAGHGLVSGDLAADMLAPWALPQRVLIYTPEGRDLSGAGFVPSPKDGASLELVTTRDPVVTPSASAQAFIAAAGNPTALPLADPLVVLWDLTRSDDLDADQAAQQLRTRLRDVWLVVHGHG